jgi:tRNA(Ile)-lysidine synthase
LSKLKNDTYKAETVRELKKVPCLASVKTLIVKGSFPVSHDNSDATLDYDKLTFPLVIRRWNAGDVFYPFGMRQKKKLSDYFIDRKYSRIEKEKALILESDGKIVWIIGERIDNRFRITEATEKLLFLKAR